MKLKYKLLLLYVGAAIFIMLVIGSFLSSALKDVTINRIAENYRQQLKHIDFGLTRLIKGIEHDLDGIAQDKFVRSCNDEKVTSFLNAPLVEGMADGVRIAPLQERLVEGSIAIPELTKVASNNRLFRRLFVSEDGRTLAFLVGGFGAEMALALTLLGVV